MAPRRNTVKMLTWSTVKPGHEYTKSNVEFAVSVLQNDAIKKLESFATDNKVTTGKFTIGDEKQHNLFMRVQVCDSSSLTTFASNGADAPQDPEVQKATGATEPVEVMAKLREMKNNFK